MRTYLVFILALSLGFINLSYLSKVFSYSKPSSNTIRVTARVDESISFFENGEVIYVESNSDNKFFIISNNKKTIGFKKTVSKVEVGNIIISSF